MSLMQRKGISRLAGFVSVVLSCIVFPLGVGELALRILKFPSPIASGWGWEQSPRRALSPPEDTGHNELGLRGTSFSYGPDDIVVLLLGDSQVEVATSPPELMPERLLEAHLARAHLPRSVKVFSLASSGWGNDQQLVALQRYFQSYRADLVLVWSTPSNDLWENAFPDRSDTAEAGHLKPTFLLDGTELKGPFFTGPVFLSESRVMELVLRARLRLLGRTKEQYLLDQWLERLPRVDRRPQEGQAAHCSSYPTIDQEQFFRNIFALPPEGVVVRTSEDVEHSRSSFSPYIAPRSDRDMYLIRITRMLLARIRELTTQHGAAFRYIYTLRNEFDAVAAQSLQCVETTTGKQFAAQWRIFELVQSLVNQEDLLVLPVLGGEEISVSPTDRHLSDYANDRAMASLANELVQQHLIDGTTVAKHSGGSQTRSAHQ
jgi:hypothetical protein